MFKRPKRVAIPEPYAEIGSLRACMIATKELVEGLVGHKGGIDEVAVSWQDLIDLGLIKKEQVPKGVRPITNQ